MSGDDVRADDLALPIRALVAAATPLIDAAKAVDEGVVADVAPALGDRVVVVDGADILHGLVCGIGGVGIAGVLRIGVVEGGRMVDNDLLRRNVHARPDLGAVAVEAIAVGGAPLLTRQEIVVVEGRRQAAGAGDRAGSGSGRGAGRRGPPGPRRHELGRGRGGVQGGYNDVGQQRRVLRLSLKAGVVLDEAGVACPDKGGEALAAGVFFGVGLDCGGPPGRPRAAVGRGPQLKTDAVGLRAAGAPVEADMGEGIVGPDDG